MPPARQRDLLDEARGGVRGDSALAPDCHPGRAHGDLFVWYVGAIRDPLRNLDCVRVGPGSTHSPRRCERYARDDSGICLLTAAEYVAGVLGRLCFAVLLRAYSQHQDMALDHVPIE